MTITSQLNILKRVPIRPEEHGSETLYFDLDGDGALAMDELSTNEPLVHSETAEEIFELTGADEERLLTEADFSGEPETETRLRECEDCDDYQYTTDGSFQGLARSLVDKEVRDSVTWAINPSVPGRPEEMEFLVLGG